MLMPAIVGVIAGLGLDNLVHPKLDLHHQCDRLNIAQLTADEYATILDVYIILGIKQVSILPIC
jgi:hypothetical protein